MACGGFMFSLVAFQSLVGWEEINLVISVNSFRLVQIESWSRRSLAPIR
jgi:hypothetical protein